jgi:hypothetical protein
MHLMRELDDEPGSSIHDDGPIVHRAVGFTPPPWMIKRYKVGDAPGPHPSWALPFSGADGDDENNQSKC